MYCHVERKKTPDSVFQLKNNQEGFVCPLGPTFAQHNKNISCTLSQLFSRSVQVHQCVEEPCYSINITCLLLYKTAASYHHSSEGKGSFHSNFFYLHFFFFSSFFFLTLPLCTAKSFLWKQIQVKYSSKGHGVVKRLGFESSTLFLIPFQPNPAQPSPTHPSPAQPNPTQLSWAVAWPRPHVCPRPGLSV